MASDASQRLLDFAPHEPRNALLFPPAYEGAQQRPVVKAIQRANTRFKEEPRARSGTAGSYPDLSSVSSETTSAAADEGLVPMTPRIMPGAGDESPLMTWGAVAATPRLLERDDRRQELGRALDALHQAEQLTAIVQRMHVVGAQDVRVRARVVELE